MADKEFQAVMQREALTRMLTLMGKDEPLEGDEEAQLEFARRVVWSEVLGMPLAALDAQRAAVEMQARLTGLLDSLLPLPTFASEPRITPTHIQVEAMQRYYIQSRVGRKE
jgi:hypothetical protein